MGLIENIKTKRTIWEWLLFTVVASFLPVIVRLFAWALHGTPTAYSDIDILFAALGVNICNLALAADTKESEDRMIIIALCVILMFVICLILGYAYKEEEGYIEISARLLLSGFALLFTFASIMLSYKSNKLLKASVKTQNAPPV